MAPAHAYVGEHAPAPAVRTLADHAAHYWDVKGVPRCSVTLLQAPDLDDAWGRGDGATCTAWISDDLADRILAPSAEDILDGCQAITHEIGHARGLGHQASGPMASTESPRPAKRFDNVPWFCVRYLMRYWRADLLNDRKFSIYWDIPHEMRALRRYVMRNRSGRSQVR